MEEIRFDSIQQVNDYYGITTLHPLVTVVHLERIDHTTTAKAQIYVSCAKLPIMLCSSCYGNNEYVFKEYQYKRCRKTTGTI